MQLILEGCHHSEIAPTTAHPPEEVRVLDRTGGKLLALGRYHINREQVVAGQTVAAGQPAYPATQGEAGNAGAGNQPSGGRQTRGLRLLVEFRPGQTRLGAG